MRGWTLVGKALGWHPTIKASDVVMFTVDEKGRHQRDCLIRGRQYHSDEWPEDATDRDYVWIARALGEKCFK